MEKGKKLIALLLCVCMALPLFGCGNEEEEEAVKGPDSAQEAIEQLALCGKEYGYENAWSELTEKRTTAVDGDSYYRLQQNYQGIPVYGRTVVFAVDENGYALSLTGNTADVDEDLDLIPTVTKEQLEAVVRAYFSDEMGADSAEYWEAGAFSGAELCIYHADNEQRSYLAYKLNAGGWEILADAHDGSVLFTRSCLDSAAAAGYLASDTERKNGFTVEQEEDGSFALIDRARGLIVYDMQGSNSDTDTINADAYVTSADNIFGNDPALEAEQEKGAILLQNASRLTDYYQDNLNFKTETELVFLFYNDGFDSGENARGGTDANGAGEIALGKLTGTEDIDILAHEYGHVISHTLVALDGAAKENRAINEAISDIFAELTEAWFYGWEAPDWIITGDNISVERNIREPGKTGHAEKTGDGLLAADGDDLSTIVSHAAYLMWNGIDGTSAKKISDKDLLKLWYRAMLLMPSNCDFTGCRTMVELAAESMNLTARQKSCIGEAFDAVGIQRADDQETACDYVVSPDSTLSVYDTDGILFAGYTLSISSTEADPALIKGFDARFAAQSRYVREEPVGTAAPYPLELPEGKYELTVSSGAFPEQSYTYRIEIDASAPKEDIPVYTGYIPRLTVVSCGETADPQTAADKALSCVNVYEGDRLAERHTLNYNEKQQLTGIVSEYYGSADEEPEIENSAYAYDGAGRLIRMDMGPSHDEFYYNGQGQLNLYRSFLGETGLHWDKVYEYDERGNILTVKEFSSDDEELPGSGDAGVTSYTYEYDEQGRLSRSIGKHVGNPASPEDYDYRVSCYTSDASGALVLKREATLTREEYASGLQQVWGRADFDTKYYYGNKPFVVLSQGSSVQFLLTDDAGNEYFRFSGGDSITLDENGYVIGAVDTVHGRRSEFIYVEVQENRAYTMEVLNALLVGAEYVFEPDRTEVSAWSDTMVCQMISGKLLWDDYRYSDQSLLGSTGLAYQTKDDGYWHFDLDLIQKITQDTLGRDFPVSAQGELAFVSGNELLLMPAFGESESFAVQNYTKQGDELIAVGTAVHNNTAYSDFRGYFQAVFRKNPASVYGYTLVSLSPIAGNQSFGRLTAEASSVLVEPNITHYARNAVDGDMKTTWVEGAGGVGVNEWIMLTAEDGAEMEISAIEFALGYQKSEQLLVKNGWPTKVLIECENGYQQTAEFYYHAVDTVLLDRPVTTSWVKITILDAVAGTVYEDTCISEIRFYGIDSTAYFAGIEQEDLS